MRDALGVYPFVHLGRHGVATKGQHQAARKKHQSHAVTFIGSENGLHYTQKTAPRFCAPSQLEVGQTQRQA